MKDDLGTRMKEQYENRTRYFIPRRTYSIIRLDGKAFHTFTKGMKRPYDEILMDLMDKTAEALVHTIQGARFAYTQSDEISLLLTDFDKITTDAWFDGNIQKMASVSASIATAAFNAAYWAYKIQVDKTELHDLRTALFDSRVFTIPDPVEVENYFVWRQKDAVRNSIAMTAQSLYSHKELNGKSSSDQQEMIHAKGQNWNDMPDGFKRGRIVEYTYDMDWSEKDPTSRAGWEIKPAFDFLKEREKLTDLIPIYGTE